MGASDTTDDLIAELAKLMADDAQGQPASKDSAEPAPAQATPHAPAEPTTLARPSSDSPQEPRQPAQRFVSPTRSDPPRATAETTPRTEQSSRDVAPPERKQPSWLQQRRATTVTPSEPAPESDAGADEAPEGSSSLPVNERPVPSWTAPRPRPTVAPVIAPRATGGGVVSQPREPNPVPQMRPAATTARPFAPQPSSASGATQAAGSTIDPIAELIAAQAEAARAQERVGPVQHGEPEPEPDETMASDGASEMYDEESDADEEVEYETFEGEDFVEEIEEAAIAPEVKPASEDDHFTVAPVFGLGGNANAPRSGQAAPVRREEPVLRSTPADPLDEIENLIGDAVRVEFEDEEQPPVARRPSRTFMRPTQEDENVDEAALAAEAAILAAAAATDRQPGRAEPRARYAEPEHDDEPEIGDSHAPIGRQSAREERPSGGLRQFVVPAVAGTLLLAVGLGAYWFFGMGGLGGDEPPPVLSADSQPVKETPPPQPQSADAATQSVVLDQLGNSNADANAPADNSEQLVSRDETGGAVGSDVSKVISPDTTETGLANRKVRTVTVRPDGTIVTSDNSTAGASKLPVDRPNVPAVPGGDTVATDPVAAMINAANSGDATAANTDAAPAQAPTTDVNVASLPAATDVQVSDPNVPIPMPRPANLPVIATPTPAPVATTPAPAASAGNGAVDLLGGTPLRTTQPAAAAPTAPSAGNAAAYVQLASRRDLPTAQQSMADLQNRYGSLLGGSQLEIQRVDLGDKGIYYRILMPAGSASEASNVCANIKANGGDCLVRSN
ncbi:MAG TPA: hypothetical protein VIL84_03875 [Devosiaceae bacterium]